MKIVKYLFFCMLDCLSFNIALTKDFIFGVLQIIVYFAVLFFSSGALIVYCDTPEILGILYGFLITIGFALTLYGVICLIEVIAERIIRFKNNFKKL